MYWVEGEKLVYVYATIAQLAINSHFRALMGVQETQIWSGVMNLDLAYLKQVCLQSVY